MYFHWYKYMIIVKIFLDIFLKLIKLLQYFLFIFTNIKNIYVGIFLFIEAQVFLILILVTFAKLFFTNHKPKET